MFSRIKLGRYQQNKTRLNKSIALVEQKSLGKSQWKTEEPQALDRESLHRKLPLGVTFPESSSQRILLNDGSARTTTATNKRFNVRNDKSQKLEFPAGFYLGRDVKTDLLANISYTQENLCPSYWICSRMLPPGCTALLGFTCHSK